MPIKRITIKKIFLALFIMALVPLPIIVSAAQEKEAECKEGMILCAILEGFNFISIQVSFAIGYIAAVLISVASAIIHMIINAGTKVVSNPVVTTGFEVSLNIANLGFVLAIIVIAFTTILRIAGYETKKLLRNLIIAALLVNFSFAIAGTIIDFANIFGNFFFNAASSNDPKLFADNLANALNVQKLSNIKSSIGDNFGGDILKFGAGYFSIFASIAAVAIFSTFLVITFFAIAFMLLVRYVYIIILLVLMPIAWLTWIFPGFSHLFNDWWKTFLKWNLFYPAVTFFLYLSIASSTKINEITKMNTGGAVAINSWRSLAVGGEDALVGLLQIFVMVGIMLGGLIAANKLGIEGAATALKMAGTARNWITGRAARVAGLPVRGAGALALRPTKAAAGGLAGLLSRPGLRWIPGAKGAAAGLAGFASRKTEVEDYQKNYLANLTKEQFQQVAQTSPVGPVAKAAILAEATKRKMVDKLTAGLSEERAGARLDLFAKAANATNPELIKDLTAVNPRFAGLLAGKTKPDDIAAEIRKAVTGIRADKAADINKDSLLDKEVAMALSEAQISNIYRSGSTEQKDNLKKALEEAAGLTDEATKKQLDAFNTEIENTLQDISKAKQEGDNVKRKVLQTHLKDLRNLIETSIAPKDTRQREAFDKLQTLKQRIANPNII